jgi:hypothetical protein
MVDAVIIDISHSDFDMLRSSEWRDSTINSPHCNIYLKMVTLDMHTTSRKPHQAD